MFEIPIPILVHFLSIRVHSLQIKIVVTLSLVVFLNFLLDFLVNFFICGKKSRCCSCWRRRHNRNRLFLSRSFTWCSCFRLSSRRGRFRLGSRLSFRLGDRLNSSRCNRSCLRFNLFRYNSFLCLLLLWLSWLDRLNDFNFRFLNFLSRFLRHFFRFSIRRKTHWVVDDRIVDNHFLLAVSFFEVEMNLRRNISAQIIMAAAEVLDATIDYLKRN